MKRTLLLIGLLCAFAALSLAQTDTLEGPHAELREVHVRVKKKKYKRRDNPAVAMIRKVIAAKRRSDLRQHDYLTYRRYERMTMALNEVTERIFEEKKFRRLPFLKRYVERSPITGKLTLPFVVDEKQLRMVYRKSDGAEKRIVEAARHEGMDELLKTGEVLRGLMDDCFTDVDLYDDDIRLLQYHFISPIATTQAIRFYHYYIEDTLEVDREKLFKLGFTPANPQDFGFSGALYILADSTWRVRRAEINVPHKSDINFVSGLDIRQSFITLPTGEQICDKSDMLLQLSLVDWLQKLQVERKVQCRDWTFSPIPSEDFEGSAREVVLPTAQKDSTYWQAIRPSPLTNSEARVRDLTRDFLHKRGFKGLLWVGKAFIESYVETTLHPDRPSYVDIGPVYKFLGSNFVEGFTLLLGAQTTAHLNPHWFLSGWAKYGCKDQKWKGQAVLTYSPRKRKYFTQEFPVSNITVSYTNDVRSPSDLLRLRDDDNAFSSLEWAKKRHMNYFQRVEALVDWEWENGLRVTGQVRRERDTPAGDLFYLPATVAKPTVAMVERWGLRPLTYTEMSVALAFQPGASYVCTKMHRLQTNYDTPTFTLRHTVGVKGMLGGSFNYNYTEASIYKRFWWRSWGKMDCLLRGMAQWNRVPWMLLCMPPANTSYLLDKNKQLFTMMRDMEFLTDRALTLTVDWDLNGKLLNRIPLFKRLKWRENIGFNLMWGALTRHNNPLEAAPREGLYLFPGRFDAAGGWEATSQPLGLRHPYAELTAGFHNIFKFFRVEYVHRLTHHRPGVRRWGIRGCFEFSF